MFQIGQEVACVIDDWVDNWTAYGVAFPLKSGRIYTIEAIYPEGTKVGGITLVDGYFVGVGVENSALKEMAHGDGSYAPVLDIWPPEWFRAVQRNAESVEQAMTIFRKMTETTKTPEVIGA
jgi:hypothetical protein